MGHEVLPGLPLRWCSNLPVHPFGPLGSLSLSLPLSCPGPLLLSQSPPFPAPSGQPCKSAFWNVNPPCCISSQILPSASGVFYILPRHLQGLIAAPLLFLTPLLSTCLHQPPPSHFSALLSDIFPLLYWMFFHLSLSCPCF